VLSAMRIDILTTFPEIFTPDPPGILGVSIPARARRAGLVQWHAHNLRQWTSDPNGRTDDRPFGGGPGMVMMCQPIWDATREVEAMDHRPATRVVLTPQGVPLTQSLVERLADKPRVLLIAGHYEGIDERVVERLSPIEVSVGDYVVSSGELAAVVLIDAVVRLLPGVLGDDRSAVQDSFAPFPGVDPTGNAIDPRVRARWHAELGVPENAMLLDCPHYTRPRVWDGLEVPPVLLSGDHGAVARWRFEQMVARTRARRPDLLPGVGDGAAGAHGSDPPREDR